MKVKVEYNNKLVTVNIPDSELEKLANEQKTGYELLPRKHVYNYVSSDGTVWADTDLKAEIDMNRYDVGNYYSNRKIAENNARADALLRNLRRFSVEHGFNASCWLHGTTPHCLEWVEDDHAIYPVTGYCDCDRTCGTVYFKDEETADLAIKAFKDELIWYFTEYQDALW